MCVPRTLASGCPSACTRRKSAAPARFAIRARAMLPMLLPGVRVRVMTTVTPARRSSVRSRSETSRTRSASRTPRHDAARPAAVLDLARRRARPDRLGLRVPEPVVARDRSRRPAAGRVRATREPEHERDRKREARRDHCGGIFVRIQTYVISAPGTKSAAATAISTFAAVESRSTASAGDHAEPAEHAERGADDADSHARRLARARAGRPSRKIPSRTRTRSPYPASSARA